MSILKGNTKNIPHSPQAVDDTMSIQPKSNVEHQYFRQSILIVGSAFFVMIFFFLAAFFLAVRGAEKTVVPSILNLELTDALIQLQERELYPRLQMKHTGNPNDKGLVISQDLEPGLYVKAGRRITVTVSQGAIIDNVEDFVGMNINDVRGRLASLFSTFEPLLVLREPIPYVYNAAPAGTILNQTPSAGTPLSGPIELLLIVSRGSSDASLNLPNWTGWNSDGAIQSMVKLPVAFEFVEDNVEPSGSKPRITTQYPPAESKVTPGSSITVKYSPPAYISEGFQYGLLQYKLQEFPVPVLLEAVLREPGKKDQILFSTPYSHNSIAFPYIAPVGSGIVIKTNGTEVFREDVLEKE